MSKTAESLLPVLAVSSYIFMISDIHFSRHCEEFWSGILQFHRCTVSSSFDAIHCFCPTIQLRPNVCTQKSRGLEPRTGQGYPLHHHAAGVTLFIKSTPPKRDVTSLLKRCPRMEEIGNEIMSSSGRERGCPFTLPQWRKTHGPYCRMLLMSALTRRKSP